MRRVALCCLLLSLIIPAAGFPAPAMAHRVNIFAYTEGPLIRAECGFPGGKKVRGGSVEVLDRKTGELLAGGKTDEQGLFSAVITEKMRSAPEGLLLRVRAGEGHRNETALSPEELAALPGLNQGGTPAGVSRTDSPQPEAEASRTQETPRRSALPAVTAGELESLVDGIVERRMLVLQREIAQARDEVRLRDITGGIGWLIGLAGIAAWSARRRA